MKFLEAGITCDYSNKQFNFGGGSGIQDADQKFTNGIKYHCGIVAPMVYSHGGYVVAYPWMQRRLLMTTATYENREKQPHNNNNNNNKTNF